MRYLTRYDPASQSIKEKKAARIIFWCLMPFFFAAFLRFYSPIFHLIYGTVFTVIFGGESVAVVFIISLVTTTAFSIATCSFSATDNKGL